MQPEKCLHIPESFKQNYPLSLHVCAINLAFREVNFFKEPKVYYQN